LKPVHNNCALRQTAPSQRGLWVLETAAIFTA
jgi:hypothetical protein